MMGTRAATRVPTATLLHIGQWLGWPEWLREGTSLAGTSGPLPAMISRADDVRIMGNIVENADIFAIVAAILTHPRPALSLAGELAVLHGPDLGSAIMLIARGLALRNLWICLEVREDEAQVEIAIRPALPMGDLFGAFAICALAKLQRSIAVYRGDALEGLRIATQLHDLPQAQGALATFGCPVVPARGAEVLRFPKAWTQQLNPHHDPLVWDVAKAKITRLANDAGGIADRDPLRDFIVDHLSRLHRVPRLKQAAVHLGISTRTIVRSLARQNTSYHKLVEEERKSRALALIADRALSLKEVAEELGFNDMSSFGRSFRQWFADTPGNMRRQACG
ncbi:helix-turn-helix domain-containing protein [Erythrobacter tepidarius]|uniref:helix-turn-helix domain-containing protein n=1 Tax=Erythrobacter tepidarius TaxID=60454 RepID=UPI001180493B|nr:AraC family transcriptional regulator [Erythrobacter tepidarius]